MTLDEANKELEKITKGMAHIPFISYAAVVKNPLKNDSYVIEYGVILNDKQTYIYGANQSEKMGVWIKNDDSEIFYGSQTNREFKSFEIKFATEGFYSEKDKYMSSLNSSGVDLLSSDQHIIHEVTFPLRSGHSIGSNSAYNKGGTLGAFFTLESDSNIYGITNQHVIGNRNTHNEENKTVNHPSAIHTEGGEFEETKVIGEIEKLIHTESIDLGIIKLKNTFHDKLESGNNGNDTPYKGIDLPKIGKSVFKYGANTKHTEGEIISVNASCRVTYDYNDVSGSIIMTNQVMTKKMQADSGDSGSIVYDKDNMIIGLLFGRDKGAGRSFFSPIDKIFNTENGNSIDCDPPYKLKNFI